MEEGRVPPRPGGGVLKPPQRRFRLLAALVTGLGVLCGLVLVVTIGLAVWARTEGGRRTILEKLLEVAAPPHGRLSAGGLETDLFSWLTLHDIVLSDAEGREVARVDTLSVRYRLGGLTGKVLRVDEARVDGGAVTLIDTPEGLSIATMWDDGSPPSTEPWGGLPIDVLLDDVVLNDVDVHYVAADTTYALDDLVVGTGIVLRGNTVGWEHLQLAGVVNQPALGPLSAATSGRWDPANLSLGESTVTLGSNRAVVEGALGRLDGDPTVGIALRALHVDADALLPLLLPAEDGADSEPPVTGVFDASGSVVGRLRAPTYILDLTTPGGPLAATGTLDLDAARPAWKLSVTPRGLSPDAFVPALATVPSRFEGTLTVEGNGFGWPDDLDAKASFALTSPTLGPVSALHARGEATVSKGVVELPRFAVDAAGAGVAGSASVRVLDRAADARVRQARLDLATLEKFGVAGLTGQGTFTGRVVTGWGDRTWVRADGNLTGTAVVYADAARVGAVAGPVVATWSPEAGATLDATLDVTDAAAGAGSVATAQVTATGGISPKGALRVEGNAALTRVKAPYVEGDTLSLTGNLTRSAAGRLEGTATIESGRLALERFVADRGTGRLHIEGDEASATLDLYQGDRTLLGLDGEADLAALAFRARRLVLAPLPDRSWTGDGVQTVRIVPGGVENLRLRLVSGGSVIAASGHGRKKDLLDLTVEATDVRLSWLEELFPEKFTGYGGLVTVRASAEGHASRPALLVDLSAMDLSIPDVVRNLDIGGQAVGGDRRLKVDATLAHGGHGLAHVVGSLPFSLAIDDPGVIAEGDVDLHLVLPPSSSTAWNAVIPGAPVPEMRASGEVSITGPLLDPALGVVAAVEAPLGRQAEWLRFDLDASTTDRVLTLRGVGRERLERRAVVDGTVALHLDKVARSLFGGGPEVDLARPGTWAGEVSVDLLPLRLPIQAFTSFARLPRTLAGDLSGGLHLSGTAASPRLEGAIFLADGRLGEVPLAPASVELVPVEGGHNLSATLGFGARGGLTTVAGFVPFAPTLEGDMSAELAREGLALDVHADAVPLAAVGAAWPSLEARTGTLGLEGRITGSILDPRPDLSFGLKDGDFVVTLTGVRYSDARFTGHLTRDELRLDDILVHTRRTSELGDERREAGGNSGIHGNVRAVRSGDTPVFSGELVLDRTWIADLPDRVLQMDGKLELTERTGHEEPGVKVTGELTVLNSQLTLAESFFTATSDLALDPSIRVVRGGPIDAAAARRVEGPPLPTWLDADVDVSLARNAFLDARVPTNQLLGNLAAAFSSVQVATQLDGDVQALVEAGEISLVGEVEPLRGTARVLGVPFDIRGNSISFTGRDYTDPVLDLVAVRTTPEYGEITANITGTPSALQLAFSPESGSGLASDDVLAVLLFGRPTSELTEAQGGTVNMVATTVLNSFVNSSSGGRTFDLFEVTSDRLRAGWSLSRNIFVLGSYNFTADQDKENVVEFTVEVQLDRNWQFDFTTGTSGISSVGLNRKWRF